MAKSASDRKPIDLVDNDDLSLAGLCILAVGLDQEMIDIGDRRLGAYLLHAHGLKLESA